MNQKSIIAILVVAVIILIGITVYFATINKASAPVVPAPKQVKSTPDPIVQQPAQSPEQKNVSLYSNTDLGFKIQLPTDFADYKTKSFSIDADRTRISFFLPTADKSFKETNAFPEKEFMPGYSEFFIIDAMTIEGWNKFLADCESGKHEMGCITEADLIGKNKQFAFQVGLTGIPAKDVAKRVENKITFEYLGKNFSILP
ncbi:hypothetical protein KKD19_04565 [Patescibacteria group bacterium]|nr:hypothetical protein [Patescibacteria group bacterium]MBU4512481.1 hypothetical protein [Patescibacteria group bacterium]